MGDGRNKLRKKIIKKVELTEIKGCQVFTKNVEFHELLTYMPSISSIRYLGKRKLLRIWVDIRGGIIVFDSEREVTLVWIVERYKEPRVPGNLNATGIFKLRDFNGRERRQWVSYRFVIILFSFLRACQVCAAGYIKGVRIILMNK